LQASGAVGFEIERDPETRHDMLIMFTNRDAPPEVLEKRERVQEILGLDSGVLAFRVLYSPFAIDGETIAIQTRSILQTLVSMSNFVEVPPERRTRSAPGYQLPPGNSRPFRVLSSSEKPEDAYAAYKYQGHWYWIDHDDLQSKQVFTLMLFLTTLTDRAGTDAAPVLTIPTG
jgi:hypothetical protein